MAQQRSGAVTAIAILHLIGGGLGLIGSLCGGAGLLMSQGMRGGGGGAGAPDIQAYLSNNVPGYMPVTVAQLVVGLVLDVLLLSAGVGLLNRQPWSRYASIVYACISIPYKIASLVFQMAFVNPAITRFFEENAQLPPEMRDQLRMTMNISSYTGLCFSLVFLLYPIAVIWVMLLPSTKRDFALAGAPHRDEDDRDDYHDRDRGRRDEDDRGWREGDRDRYRE